MEGATHGGASRGEASRENLPYTSTKKSKKAEAITLRS